MEEQVIRRKKTNFKDMTEEEIIIHKRNARNEAQKRYFKLHPEKRQHVPYEHHKAYMKIYMQKKRDEAKLLNAVIVVEKTN